jgi:hypothetical protein
MRQFFAVSSPPFRLALAGSALALFAAAWLGLQVRQQRQQLAALDNQRQTLENTVGNLQNQISGLQQRGQDLSRQLDEERQRQSETLQNKVGGALRLLGSIVLSPGLVRGSNDVAQLKIAPGQGTVRLQLDLATVDEHPSYRVELRGAAGKVVWNGNSLKPRAMNSSKAIVIDLSSAILQAGEHELSLEGVNAEGKADTPVYFYFNVGRQ